MCLSTPRAGFAQIRDQHNRVTGGSNVASDASYWCHRRETSEIQAKAYVLGAVSYLDELLEMLSV